MAIDNHTLQVEGAGEDAPTTVKDELDGALYDLSCGISVVKTLQEALSDSDFDWGVRDQTLGLAVRELDKAYERFDLALVRLANEGRTPSKEVQS